MDWFNMIKDYYNSGYYTKEQVAVFVQKGKLTPVQYEAITGDVYV
jgi:uncharacterized XkdX family phage protein